MLGIHEERTMWLSDAAPGSPSFSTGDIEMVDYLMTHYETAKAAFKAKEEDLMQVQSVSMQSPNPNYDKDSDGNMVLHIAVWSGQVRALPRSCSRVDPDANG
jgi:hypothetical protein